MASVDNRQDAAGQLMADWGGVSVSFTWFGVRKALSADQKAEAADHFDADAKFLSAAKKLLDTKHDAYRAVSAAKREIVDFWKGNTLPYPEPGIRIIRQDRIEDFVATMQELRQKLLDAVRGLDNVYSGLRHAARQRLGSLYNSSDYPPTLVGLFGVEWDFPSLQPPQYLMMSANLYAECSARVAARFEQAVTMAEDVFIGELASLVQTLQDKLAGKVDGVTKRLHDVNVDAMREFFEKFRRLNIHSSEALDGIVEQAEKALTLNGLFDLGGVSADQLRESPSLRQAVATKLSAVSAQLDGLMVNRPRRAINRRSKAVDGE